MIKRLFVIIAILFAGFALNAQEQMRDVVYLKNGGITKIFKVDSILNSGIEKLFNYLEEV